MIGKNESILPFTPNLSSLCLVVNDGDRTSGEVLTSFVLSILPLCRHHLEELHMLIFAIDVAPLCEQLKTNTRLKEVATNNELAPTDETERLALLDLLENHNLSLERLFHGFWWEDRKIQELLDTNRLGVRMQRVPTLK